VRRSFFPVVERSLTDFLIYSSTFSASMMDTYNLGWKLAAVLRGQATPSILETYQEERHKTAKELIDLDYQLSRMFASKPRADDDVNGEGISLTEFKKVRRRPDSSPSSFDVDLLSRP
jgi:2-polyprenyl-6-methoxyphenol hydroxylase-like FAD-dependent oxidoreductase